MRKFLSLFLVIGLFGCGDISGLSSDVQGTYRLHSVNGDAVPILLDDDGIVERWIVDAELRVQSDGRFVETFLIEEVEPGRTSRAEEQYTGTWSGSRSTLRFRYDSDGYIYDADYDGDELILYDDFDEIVYVRR